MTNDESTSDSRVRDRRKGAIGRLLATPLAVRIAALTGIALITAGYVVILGASSLPGAPDVQKVTRYALGGIALVIGGAMIELMLVVVMARR